MQQQITFNVPGSCTVRETIYIYIYIYIIYFLENIIVMSCSFCYTLCTVCIKKDNKRKYNTQTEHLPGPRVAGAGEGFVVPSSATAVGLIGELLGTAGNFCDLFTLLGCCSGGWGWCTGDPADGGRPRRVLGDCFF